MGTPIETVSLLCIHCRYSIKLSLPDDSFKMFEYILLPNLIQKLILGHKISNHLLHPFLDLAIHNGFKR